MNASNIFFLFGQSIPSWSKYPCLTLLSSLKVMMEDRLKKGVIVLDGGLSSPLISKGFNLMDDPLWTARILIEYPEAIIDAHMSYLQNGAEIITTSSYQTSISGFQKYQNLDEEESKNLMKFSVELAKRARCRCSLSPNAKNKILIAGSVGPYGACLADGSEYTGSYFDTVSHEELVEWHRPRIACLVEGGVDVLAFETIPGCKEAEALMSVLEDFPNMRAWLSFSCGSMHQTYNGDDLVSCVAKCLRFPSADQLVAVGVNCTAPEYVESLLMDINSVSPSKPLIAYPNSGQKWDHKTGWSGPKTVLDHSFLKNWLQQNVRIIGGCCATTPEDIAEISNFVNQTTV